MSYVIGLDETSRKPSIWAKAQDGVPTDRQMLTWDTGALRYEYQWPGITNFSENRTFTVLPAGSTVAVINTALTDYDVVYLEPGNYTMAGTPIAIGSGKALIGLGNSAWGDTGGPLFTAAGATGANFVTMDNGLLLNASFSCVAAQANDIIAGNTTNYANIVEKVYVSAVAACTSVAFTGGFIKINQFRVVNINGVYISQSGADLFGPTQITNFKFYGCPTSGIHLACGMVNISGGYIDGAGKVTDYGIYYTGAGGFGNYWIYDVYFVNCINGVFYDWNATRPWRVVVRGCTADSCTVGYSFSSIGQLTVSDCRSLSCSQSGYYFYDVYYLTITGCSALSCTQRGFYWNQCYIGSAAGLKAVDCNGTAGVTYGSYYVNQCSRYAFSALSSNSANNVGGNTGLYMVNCTTCTVSSFASQVDTDGFTSVSCLYSSFSTLAVYDPGRYGVFSNACQRCTLAGVHVYSSGSYGVYLLSSNVDAFSDITVTGSASYGIVIDGPQATSFTGLVAQASVGGIYINATYSSFSALTANENTSYGIIIGSGSTCTGCSFSGLSAYSNTNIGVYVVNATRCAFAGISAVANTGAATDGVMLSAASYCSFSSVSSVVNGRYGVYLAGTYMSLSNINVYGNTSHGIYSTCVGSNICGFNAWQNGGSGLFVSTNNYLGITGGSSHFNTGFGVSIAVSPTTANTSFVDGIICVSNTGGNWNGPAANWRLGSIW